MKRNVRISLYISALVVLVVLLIVSNMSRRNTNVRQVQVTIEGNSQDSLVSSRYLEEWLVQAMPTLLGSRVKDVDCRSIEQTLQENPFVESNRANVSVGGDIQVQVHPRIPILHLFYKGKEFYLDKDGKYMPLSQQGYANILIGNGFFNIPLPEDLDSLSPWQMENARNYRLLHMWQVANFLYGHNQYGPLFDQVYINDIGDICLVPKVGDHIVVLGDTENLERKFSDLVAFYKEGCSKVGWNTYKQISLKYQGQVICTRRNS